MELQAVNFIGNDTSRNGDVFFKGYDPIKNKELEPAYPEASNEEISLAVEKAVKAFSLFRKTTAAQRQNFLQSIADEILMLGDDLIYCCMNETALSFDRLTGERTRTVNQLKMFADLITKDFWNDVRIDRAIPNKKPVPKKDIRQMQIPIGPVAVFGAGNFPLAFSVAGGDTASALAAGCPVVYKAHPGHPATSEMIAHAIIKAVKKSKMPDGVFSLVNGLSTRVGEKLVSNPNIKAVGFTGSFKGGKALFDLAALRDEPIPVYAEMGSTNPIFLLPMALRNNADYIVEGIINSFTLGSGQFCTNPGLIIISKSDDTSKFLEKLGKRTGLLSPAFMLSKRMKDNFENGINKLQSIKDVKVISKGIKALGSCETTSYLLETTAKQFVNNENLEMEVFGPSTLIVLAKDKNEIQTIATKLGGHLTASIHCNDEKELSEYMELVETLTYKVGRLIINDYPTGVEVCDSMHHGGPYPATSDVRFTSVGTAAIKRWLRPVSFQNFPERLLPDALKNSNPENIYRLIDGILKKA